MLTTRQIDARIEKGKWKRLAQQLLDEQRSRGTAGEPNAAVADDDAQPQPQYTAVRPTGRDDSDDGHTERPVHAGSIPWQDMPGDCLTSPHMPSTTAPVDDTVKGTVRLANARTIKGIFNGTTQAMPIGDLASRMHHA